jgi:hypothetical protein
MSKQLIVGCPTCAGTGVVLSRPAGAGHSDDLAEYVPCPKCQGGLLSRSDGNRKGEAVSQDTAAERLFFQFITMQRTAGGELSTQVGVKVIQDALDGVTNPLKVRIEELKRDLRWALGFCPGVQPLSFGSGYQTQAGWKCCSCRVSIGANNKVIHQPDCRYAAALAVSTEGQTDPQEHYEPID